MQCLLTDHHTGQKHKKNVEDDYNDQGCGCHRCGGEIAENEKKDGDVNSLQKSFVYNLSYLCTQYHQDWHPQELYNYQYIVQLITALDEIP